MRRKPEDFCTSYRTPSRRLIPFQFVLHRVEKDTLHDDRVFARAAQDSLRDGAALESFERLLMRQSADNFTT